VTVGSTRTRDTAAAAPVAVGRDQPESAFALILGSLIRRTPGARAAALVDFDGETVDYAGKGDAFALKVAAAHWRIVLAEARAQPALARTEWISLRSSAASFIVRGLPEGYAILVVLARGAGVPAILRRAFDHCATELGREAGWPNASASATVTWVAIDVVSENSRPVAIRRDAVIDPVEVIGLLSQGLGRRERGWRVRTASGLDVTLIQEPSGLWYADELAAATPCNFAPLRPRLQKPTTKRLT
jgi:hypothetical protein